MEYPVVATDEGVNLKPDLMQREQLYHCVFQKKLLLFFKDSQDFLNCYEIEEPDLVEQAKGASDDEIEKIFEEYLKKQSSSGTNPSE